MTQGWSPRHNCCLVDWHCILGVVRNYSMARLMVGRDGLVLFINYNALPLRAWTKKKNKTHK